MLFLPGVLVLLFLGWSLQASGRSPITPSDATMVRVVPAAVSLQSVGERATLDICLEDVEAIYGIDVRLHFDPAVVSVPAGRVTPQWEVFDASSHFVVKNEADNTAGTVWYAITNINPAQPFSGSGRICSLEFRGDAEGLSAVEFTYAKGSDRNGTPIWPAMVNGLITVGEVHVGRPAAWLPLVVFE